MNKIIVEESNLRDNISLESDNSYYITESSKKVVFNVNKSSDIIVNFFNNNDIDTEYEFNILDDTNIEINIFDASENIKRNITANMNGQNTFLKLNISAISLNENNCNVNILHNSKKTHSECNIHGLTLDNNKIFIKNNGYIKKGSSKSTLNQDNKIIIMNDNNSKIEPNLFIDEYDIEASHGAYIGKFDSEELFYLNSRGIDDKTSYSLLISGFLIGGMNIPKEDKDYLKDIINKYWR